MSDVIKKESDIARKKRVYIESLQYDNEVKISLNVLVLLFYFLLLLFIFPTIFAFCSHCCSGVYEFIGSVAVNVTVLQIRL